MRKSVDGLVEKKLPKIVRDLHNFLDSLFNLYCGALSICGDTKLTRIRSLLPGSNAGKSQVPFLNIILDLNLAWCSLKKKKKKKEKSYIHHLFSYKMFNHFRPRATDTIKQK